MALLLAFGEVLDIDTAPFAARSQSQHFSRKRLGDELLEALNIYHNAGSTTRNFVPKIVVVPPQAAVWKKGGTDRLNRGIIHNLFGGHTHLAATALLHNFISHINILGIGFGLP